MRTSSVGSFLAVFALLGQVQGQGQVGTPAVQSQVSNPDACAVSVSASTSASTSTSTSISTPISASTSTHTSIRSALAASNRGFQIQPGATVADACASYADLDNLNAKLNPLVKSLCTETDFFSYYRLNLYNKTCPFWSDENGLCGNIACAVTTLDDEDEIPLVWRAEELSRLQGPKAHHPDIKEQRERPQKPLGGELGDDVGESCVVEYDECDERDYCIPEDESATAKGDYVSLLNNAERFTGYSGEAAHQVWEAIYRENCFAKPLSIDKASTLAGASSPGGVSTGHPGKAAQDLKSVMREHGMHEAQSLEHQLEFEDQCLEKRVFHRVISGMHASISTHLCYDYLNQTTGQWGPNLQCYKERLHEHPEYLSNLYFNFAFVSRAVSKLKDYVQDYTFCASDPVEDQRTKQLVLKLANQLPAGSEIFDETVMFKDDYPSQTGISLKEDFRNRFRNVSRIMDCVGCDKCRLWGKLQTNGFGTALKVLFEFGDDDTTKPAPSLRRTELVALINTLEKISHALKAVGEFKRMVEEENLDSDNTQADDDDDDDYEEFNNPPRTPRPSKSFKQSLDDEFSLVWQATLFILKSWVQFPGKMYVPLFLPPQSNAFIRLSTQDLTAITQSLHLLHGTRQTLATLCRPGGAGAQLGHPFPNNRGHVQRGKSRYAQSSG